MMMPSKRPDRRRMERIRFREALVARFGTSMVLVLDLSPLGAGIEHYSPLKQHVEKQLRLAWRDEAIDLLCSLYETGNDEHRGLIRNMAALSVDELLQRP